MSEIKYVYVNGCSYTGGNGLSGSSDITHYESMEGIKTVPERYSYLLAKKFDAVESANYNYDGLKSIDARTYASQVLPLTTIGWDKLTDKGKDRLIEGFDGETQTYKLIGSEAEINKKAAKVQILINDETSEAIKKAKGNSFLINQIAKKVT